MTKIEEAMASPGEGAGPARFIDELRDRARAEQGRLLPDRLPEPRPISDEARERAARKAITYADRYGAHMSRLPRLPDGAAEIDFDELERRLMALTAK